MLFSTTKIISSIYLLSMSEDSLYVLELFQAFAFLLFVSMLRLTVDNGVRSQLFKFLIYRKYLRIQGYKEQAQTNTMEQLKIVVSEYFNNSICKLNKFNIQNILVKQQNLPLLFIINIFFTTRMEPEKKNPSFVTSKGNQIWTVSLYLAWQQFQKQSKFNVQIPENATTAKNMVQTLRSLKCSPNQVDSGVYYRAGAGNAIITTINSDLEERFQKQDAEKMERIKHDQVVFYGAVIEKLQMKYPFQIIPGKIMHFCKVKVPCFEPLTANQRSQVFIVNYTNQDNFLIRIELADKGHQFFALMTKHKLNLEQVFERIRISDDEGEPMTNYDTFKIPQLKIKASHVMTDLSCTRLKFPGDNKKYEVSQLVQNVTLEMIGKDQEDDMSGLTLSVPESENPKLKRRRLCLNNPFWVVLRIKGFRPYFGMYVNKAIDIP